MIVPEFAGEPKFFLSIWILLTEITTQIKSPSGLHLPHSQPGLKELFKKAKYEALKLSEQKNRLILKKNLRKYW